MYIYTIQETIKANYFQSNIITKIKKKLSKFLTHVMSSI